MRNYLPSYLKTGERAGARAIPKENEHNLPSFVSNGFYRLTSVDDKRNSECSVSN